MANRCSPAPDWLTGSYVEGILKKCFKNQSIKVSELVITAGSSVGDNFLGQIFRVKIEFQENGELNQISIIVKICPKTAVFEEMNQQLNIFDIEATFYSEILTTINQKFKEKKNQKFCPKCYYVDYENQAILLEDLGVYNYKMHPKRQYLTLDQAISTVEKLATLHGASYFIINENPELIKKLGKSFIGQEGNVVSAVCVKNTYTAIKKFINNYGLSDRMSNILTNLQIREEQELKQVGALSDDHLNFLLHGDAWMNNLMFLYNNENLTDSILLDFQGVNFNSFANDLLYFIFSSVQAQVIVENIDFILESYYNKLKNVAPEIENLSLERVKLEFSERLFYGLIIAVGHRGFTISDDPPDFEKMMKGELFDLGFNKPSYISDLKLFLDFFEKRGVI